MPLHRKKKTRRHVTCEAPGGSLSSEKFSGTTKEKARGRLTAEERRTLSKWLKGVHNSMGRKLASPPTQTIGVALKHRDDVQASDRRTLRTKTWIIPRPENANLEGFGSMRPLIEVHADPGVPSR